VRDSPAISNCYNYSNISNTGIQGHQSSAKVIEPNFEQLPNRTSNNFWVQGQKVIWSLIGSRLLVSNFEQVSQKVRNSSVGAHLSVTGPTPHHGKRYFYWPGKLHDLWFTRCGKVGRTGTALAIRASRGVQHKEIALAVLARPKTSQYQRQLTF